MLKKASKNEQNVKHPKTIIEKVKSFKKYRDIEIKQKISPSFAAYILGAASIRLGDIFSNLTTFLQSHPKILYFILIKPFIIKSMPKNPKNNGIRTE